MNVKRIYRLYTEEGLQLRHKTPKRRVAAKLRGDRSPPAAPNQVWAMDFLSDQLFNGRRIRILTIVDAFSRLSPAIDVRPHYRGTDVVETLERVTGIHGTPQTIRLDNGPEFISKALDLWAWLNGVTLDFSRPGKPTDNAFIESFNGSFRAECLNASWFLSLADARSKCEAWRTEYNQFRPHSLYEAPAVKRQSRRGLHHGHVSSGGAVRRLAMPGRNVLAPVAPDGAHPTCIRAVYGGMAGPSLDPACFAGATFREAGPISISASFSPTVCRPRATRPSSGRVQPDWDAWSRSQASLAPDGTRPVSW